MFLNEDQYVDGLLTILLPRLGNLESRIQVLISPSATAISQGVFAYRTKQRGKVANYKISFSFLILVDWT